jgi:hypothetical protein
VRQSGEKICKRTAVLGCWEGRGIEGSAYACFRNGDEDTWKGSLGDGKRVFGELRLYDEAPLRSRPSDLISVVASRTQYSPQLVDSLRKQGKTAWRRSTTLTASYSMRAAAGSYLNLSASYIHGPAITPRVPGALNLTASWTVFF